MGKWNEKCKEKKKKTLHTIFSPHTLSPCNVQEVIVAKNHTHTTTNNNRKRFSNSASYMRISKNEEKTHAEFTIPPPPLYIQHHAPDTC